MTIDPDADLDATDRENLLSVVRAIANASSGSGSPQIPADAHEVRIRETLERFWANRMAEDAADIAFAESVGAIVTEGPWENVPEIRVAYVGVTLGGERVELKAIPSFWRHQPARIGSIRVHQGEGKTIARRIYLGRDIPGAVVGKAGGTAPVEAYGLVDGREFYFRSRGDSWQMRIADTDAIRSPEWVYRESCGTWPEAGRISEDAAYDFIEKAIEHFRSGMPSMAREQ